MKNTIHILILFLFLYNSLEGQNNGKALDEFNFDSTTNPAFSLLEETPSVISTPNDIKSLGLYLSNGFSNTNIALEVNPYWFIDFDIKRSYRNYRGIKTKADGTTTIDPFIGIKTNTSISVGYIDKKFAGFDTAKKTIAFGLRTTLLEFYNKARIEKIEQAISNIEIGVTAQINVLFEDYYNDVNNKIGSGTCANFETDEDLQTKFYTAAEEFLEREDTIELLQQLGRSDITKEEVVAEYFNERCKIVVNSPKKIKPNFRLDGALAYSVLFKENEINTSTANRFGSWLTADFAVKFNEKQYVHLYGISKYVDDGFNLINGVYDTRNFWDYGGKIELELNKFKLAYEYLKRDGEGDEFRSVGSFSFQFKKNITITGGFGKDFPEDDNLVTLLGVNWGINTK